MLKLYNIINEINNFQGDSKFFIKQFTIPLSKINLLSWLDKSINPQKIYWSNRAVNFESAILGFAETYKNKILKSKFQLAWMQMLDLYPDLQIYGGVEFPSKKIDAEWKHFPTSLWVLPEIEIRKVNEDFTLFVILNQNNLKNKVNIISEIKYITAIENTGSSYNIKVDYDLNHDPDISNWSNNVKLCLDKIEKNKINKAVLARKTTVFLKGPVNIFNLLAILKSKNPDCFRFYFQFSKDSIFFGASPERLFMFEVNNNYLKTEAIAGTRIEEENYNIDLNVKEENEHNYVRDYIVEYLTKYGYKNIKVENRRRLKLWGLEHFQSIISTNSIKNNAFDLIKLLHPTPAVAGSPKNAAIKEINKLEKFKRGWFCGAVGTIGKFTELSVAIRCGLKNKDKLILFAGAGIVEGSKANLEWQEINAKIAPVLKILNGKV